MGDYKGMIITKTPFRMSFFGGGTDMENYFKKNAGGGVGSFHKLLKKIAILIYGIYPDFLIIERSCLIPE